MKKYGGFEITCLPGGAGANRLVNVPMHIPIIPFRLKKKTNVGFAAVHAGKLFSSNGERISGRYLKRGIAAELNITENTKKCLEFYVKDSVLEGFWDKRDEIYKQLKSFDFEFIIAPNFSIYEDAPRIDHLYNIKRSSIVYNELLENNINAVPDISYFNLPDLNQWVNQINKNNIKLVAFSFQNVGVGLKPSNTWKQNITGLRYLCQNIDTDVEIILAGVVSPFRVASIYESINRSHRLHILNQSAFIQRCKGILSETREMNSGCNIERLFKRNIDYFNTIYTELCNSDHVNRLMQLPKKELINLYTGYTGGEKKKKQQIKYKILKRLIKKKHIKVGELNNAKIKKGYNSGTK